MYLDEFNKIPYFAQPGWDGSLWGPLLEKAWAKTNGNYENLDAGFPSEGFKFLTNAPTATYTIADLDADSLWAIVNDADSDNYMMSIWTDQGPDGAGDTYEDPKYHLPYSHAYTILETREVTAVDGTIYRLMKVRNPWR